MTVQAYLFFDGNCEEAIHFYQQAVGATVQMLMRYQQSPGPEAGGGCPGMHADFGDKVMHANLQIGNSQVMMADDCTGHPSFQGFSLSLGVADEAEARQRFDALADGGSIIMPLGPTFFSPSFGMLKDRFGVTWMVIVHAPTPQ